MNFDLADKLIELLKVKKLDEAIEFSENELKKIPMFVPAHDYELIYRVNKHKKKAST
ncbi:hypothetical protein [Sunxiuqinia sp. sy24]|uniref:hypothetical protein n=1 Tax=Sunxiuqinia sp. sy24 TaxID=3461495 RepID=UPI00404642E3